MLHAYCKAAKNQHRGVEPGPGMNQAPVGPENRADRAPVEGARGDSPMLHAYCKAAKNQHRGVEPGPGVNDSPVGCQSRPTLAAEAPRGDSPMRPHKGKPQLDCLLPKSGV